MKQFTKNALFNWSRKSAAFCLCVSNVLHGSKSSDLTGLVITIILIIRGRGVGGQKYLHNLQWTPAAETSSTSPL